MAVAQAYPVRVDAPPSRGLWLVKWILVIPRYIVLSVLWLALIVLSAVAMVAIAVTGRYRPFRLDTGGPGPGTLTLPPTAGPAINVG